MCQSDKLWSKSNDDHTGCCWADIKWKRKITRWALEYKIGWNKGKIKTHKNGF